VANLDSGFLQIPHWLPCGSGLAVLLVLKVRRGVSSGTLAFAYMFPAPRAMAGVAPASRLTCRSHALILALLVTAAASAADDDGFNLTDSLVPTDERNAGGPPRYGIPALNLQSSWTVVRVRPAWCPARHNEAE